METVLQHGRFINGPEVALLEEKIREYTGAKDASGCGNGTDALQIALMAIGLEPGDEVITTPFSFAATVEVISLLQARPVFVDIDPRTFLLDVNQVG